jgi:hypothetical protein
LTKRRFCIISLQVLSSGLDADSIVQADEEDFEDFGIALEDGKEKTVFLRHLCIKCIIILPRQARDKRRESSTLKTKSGVALGAALVRAIRRARMAQ